MTIFSLKLWPIEDMPRRLRPRRRCRLRHRRRLRPRRRPASAYRESVWPSRRRRSGRPSSA